MRESVTVTLFLLKNITDSAKFGAICACGLQGRPYILSVLIIIYVLERVCQRGDEPTVVS